LEGEDKLIGVMCGVLLEKYILRATRFEVRLSFFSQPVALPKHREELRGMTGKGHPQLLFSVDCAKPVKHTPRRALDDVLIKK
jgi:hypothetical protein